MYIKEFKNGNFNIAPEKEDKEFFQAKDFLTFTEWIREICDNISSDFTVASEDFGFSTDVLLYNYKTNLFYNIDFNDNIKFDDGYVVKIIGYKDSELYQELTECGMI